MNNQVLVIDYIGFCFICNKSVSFYSQNTWYRDWLKCSCCGSIPRERAVALALEELRPNYLKQVIHESSRTPRGISAKLKGECNQYTETQFFPDESPGQIIQGFRNENLETLTFPDATFDLFFSLDVMEYVNFPERVFQEGSLVIKPGGCMFFTTPTYKNLLTTERRAFYRNDGSVDYIRFEPEYYGNPVSNKGELVTFHFGYDLPELISQWSLLDLRVYCFHNKCHGTMGEFNEVYLCQEL